MSCSPKRSSRCIDAFDVARDNCEAPPHASFARIKMRVKDQDGSRLSAAVSCFRAARAYSMRQVGNEIVAFT
jgi:hypothetical protein